MIDNLLQQGEPGDTAGEIRFFALALIAGSLVGFLGSIFHWLIDHLVVWPRWLAGYLDGWQLAAAAAFVTMACALVSVFFVRRLAPEAGGSGVQEIEGAMEGLREVRWRRVLPVKFVAGVISISSGLVLGREGPTIHIGASLSAAVAEVFRTSELERRGLLAAGAAAGLACAFNAPAAAVLFVIEETHKEFPYTFRTYIGVILAATASTVVTQLIGGTAPDLPLLAEHVPLSALWAFVGLGILVGVLGTFLNASLLRAVAFNARSYDYAPYLYPALIGLVVGALMVIEPRAVTGGESIILQLPGMNVGVATLLLLALLRFVTMVGSYSSGAPGGIFAPILALAVCVGLAFGGIAQLLMPDAGFAPVAFAIAAMGGLFTASVRAPIVGVVLTLELTGSYVLVMPLMITCVVADVVAQWSGGRPIYTQLLERTLGRKQDDKEPTGLA